MATHDGSQRPALSRPGFLTAGASFGIAQNLRDARRQRRRAARDRQLRSSHSGNSARRMRPPRLLLLRGAAPRLLHRAAAAPPDRVQTVVVGGGIIGASTAYHIAKAGGDVLLLERDALTSGTTWHAAGLMVTFGSLSSTATWMRQHSKELYSRVLEEETGMSTGFAPVGFIELAADRDRLEARGAHRTRTLSVRPSLGRRRKKRARRLPRL